MHSLETNACLCGMKTAWNDLLEADGIVRLTLERLDDEFLLGCSYAVDPRTYHLRGTVHLLVTCDRSCYE